MEVSVIWTKRFFLLRNPYQCRNVQPYAEQQRKLVNLIAGSWLLTESSSQRIAPPTWSSFQGCWNEETRRFKEKIKSNASTVIFQAGRERSERKNCWTPFFRSGQTFSTGKSRYDRVYGGQGESA